MFFGVVNANAQENVRITQPTNGTQVPQFDNTIRLTVRSGVPAGQCIIVFIQDPNMNWWPYMDVLSVPGSNTWEVVGVQFGMPNNTGRTFRIRAVIMNRSVQTDGLGISMNQDGSIRLNNFASFINGINANNYSAIVSVTRK